MGVRVGVGVVREGGGGGMWTPVRISFLYFFGDLVFCIFCNLYILWDCLVNCKKRIYLLIHAL